LLKESWWFRSRKKQRTKTKDFNARVVEEVNKALISYSSKKRPLKKLGDTPKEAIVITPAQEKQAKF
jgi:hypothetical protein